MLNSRQVDTLTNDTKGNLREYMNIVTLAIGMKDTLKFTNLEVLEKFSYLEANSLIFIKTKKTFENMLERPSKPVPSIEKPSML